MQYRIKRPQALSPRLRRFCVRPLIDLMTDYVARGVRSQQLKIPKNILPDELYEKIFSKVHRLIHHPTRLQIINNERPFIYARSVVDSTIRVSAIVFDDSRSMYLRMVCRNPLVVCVLTPDDDRRLNKWLLDYVIRSSLLYVNLRRSPYCD